MRVPKMTWTEAGDEIRFPGRHAAVLMANGSVQTGDGQVLVAQWGIAGMMNPQASYEAWCRRAARAVHPGPWRYMT
jgi:hypothetical protein